MYRQSMSKIESCDNCRVSESLYFLHDPSARFAQSVIYALISPVIISLNLAFVLLPEENTVFKTIDPIQECESIQFFYRNLVNK